MEKLAITAYTDENFRTEYKSAFELQINPEKIKLERGIKYAEDRQLGSLNGSNTFVRYKPESLSFECIVDCTGTVEGTKDNQHVKNIVKAIEERLYFYNSDAHRPSFVKVNYGDMVFRGQLKSMETEYSLFNESGIPFRSNLKITLTGYCSSDEEKKKNTKYSPDVSRLIVLKEGQTLASLCQDVYNNSLLVTEVARFNNLNGFRSVPAGTEILFPALKKN